MPVLPLTNHCTVLFSKGRISSLTHSEEQPSNRDEPEPLSKQLHSDSMRLKQASGVTEFSHLPKEINKCAVLPREDVPPASSTGKTFRRKPREEIPGSGTQSFLRQNAAMSCPEDPPSGHLHVRGRVAPRPLPSLRCTLCTGQVLNLSAPLLLHC